MPFRELLRADLAKAKNDKDTERVSLIRTLIAAIENAEAVDLAEAGQATEVPRRRLSDDDIKSIILDEGDDLGQAADEYNRRGHGEEAQRLRVLSKVADRYAATFNNTGT